MSQNQSKTEYLEVYVTEGEGDKAFWTKIGAAWPHKDQEGFSIHLTALPIDGKLTVRKPRRNDRERS